MRALKEIENILDDSINAYMQKHSIPGIAIGIVLDNELAFTKGFGVKNIETGELVEELSMFHSASISKTFVVTALMQLQERKLLDINSTVIEYLPYFKLKDDRYKKITIKQMMSHISGMPDVYDYEWDKPQYGEEALEKYVKGICDIELLWEPGERYSYSNLAYEILGAVIAKVSEMSFEAYIKQYILQPLGMNNSSFLIGEVSKAAITSPHVLNIDEGYRPRVNSYYPYNRIHGPSSTLWSNVSELCSYAIAHLNLGSFGEAQLLSKESYYMMWQPYAETNKTATCIGFSWFLKHYKGVDIIFHTGGDTGYISNLVLIPEKHAAFAFYCNCDYINLNLITEHILDIILGFEVQELRASAAPELVRAIADSGIASAIQLFADITTKRKEKYLISDAEFNGIAYRYLQAGMLDEAIAVLNMAVGELPDSYNLYDSLGEMHMQKGEKEKAAEYYKKSLVLNPQNASGIKALKDMGIEI